jgi:hypothetical protein
MLLVRGDTHAREDGERVYLSCVADFCRNRVFYTWRDKNFKKQKNVKKCMGDLPGVVFIF